ncbi:hypothetical protein [Mesorhizobium sp.]|uniref:hypothetical protein n=1 Tax=Mesorhizobium sp. TaxID=1871066 RepID=UPI0013E3F4A1|nr:hypothetical protein [Mesorhizobium sp.]
MVYRSSMDEGRNHRLRVVELPMRSFVPVKDWRLCLRNNGESTSLAAHCGRTLAVF